MEPWTYNRPIKAIPKTEVFAEWLDGLSDILAHALISVKIEVLGAGNPGDVGPVGEGIPESRLATDGRSMFAGHGLRVRSSFRFHRLCDEIANRWASSRILTISLNTGDAFGRGRGFFRRGR